MALLPYYTLYPQDFDCDEHIRMMDDSELGMFMRFLNHSWINNGLPAATEDLQRLFRYAPDTFNQQWVRVSPCFPISADGRRRNERQEQERLKAVEKTEQAKRAAKSRHAPAQRKQSVRTADAMPRAYDIDSDYDSRSEIKEIIPIASIVDIGAPSPLDTLEELKPIYQKAGAPIPGKHEQFILQQLIGLTAPQRNRVTNYVKFAVVSGKWPSPSKTKALRSLLSDGDWDVEVTPAMLQRARAPAKGSVVDRAGELFDAMRRETASGGN